MILHINDAYLLLLLAEIFVQKKMHVLLGFTWHLVLEFVYYSYSYLYAHALTSVACNSHCAVTTKHAIAMSYTRGNFCKLNHFPILIPNAM